jgi:hypothetical protein
MPAFDCLGDPVRRRILGARIDGEQAVGEVGAAEQDELGTSQSRWSRNSRRCYETTGSPPSEPSAPDA